MRFEAKSSNRRLKEVFLSFVLLSVPVASCQMTTLDEINSPRSIPRDVSTNRNSFNDMLFEEPNKTSLFLKQMKGYIEEYTKKIQANKSYNDDAMLSMYDARRKNIFKNKIYLKKITNLKRQG